MALGKVTQLIVVLLCRYILFVVIFLTAWFIHGAPNINTALLTVFLSLIIPLPPVSTLAFPVEYVTFKVMIIARAYNRAQQFFIGLPWLVLDAIFYGFVETSFRYVINLVRFTIPNLIAKVSAVPLKISFSVLRFCITPVLNAFIFIVKMTLCRIMMLLDWVPAVYFRIFRTGIYFFVRKAVDLLFTFVSTLVCLPVVPLLVNMLVTGHFYPGSLIRFQRCAKYDFSTACYAMFLEFSWCVWSVLSTGLFLITCRTTNRVAWNPPKSSLTSFLNGNLGMNNPAYSKLFFCSAVLPLVMKWHGLPQTIHNMLCTANLTVFLVLLNGYHCRTVNLVYHGLCIIAINAQSVSVALYHVYKNLQTQDNNSIVTFLYTMELYLTFLVIVDSTVQIIRKLRHPEQDILSQEPVT